MKIIHNVILPIQASHEDAVKMARLMLNFDQSVKAGVYRESIDTRHYTPTRVFSVYFETEEENPQLLNLAEYSFSPEKYDSKKKVCIIGMGPAGLFCALTLVEFGFSPILFDRGDAVESRVKAVENFWKNGELDENSNVQFGEGGAGTFSDGKLTTRVNDPRSRRVLELFVKYGAPEDILYKAKPHIGTDVLRRVVINIRKDIEQKGGSFFYRKCFDDLKIKDGKVSHFSINKTPVSSDFLVLAIGNGAFDSFKMLMKKELVFEEKPISIGFRQEHLQSDIDYAKYGDYTESLKINPAEYLFSTHLSKDACCYSFCMCPGGNVVNSSSENGRLVTNGMSYRKRNSLNANAAMLLNINSLNILEAMQLQESIERAAFKAADGNGAIMSFEDFINGSKNKKLGIVKPSFLPAYEFTDFYDIFPAKILDLLKKGVAEFDRFFFKGKKHEAPVFTAPETRSSSPLRLKRNPESLSAIAAKGLYPCGEGAGYAGGIMSSAIDGIRVAEAIIKSSSN